MVCPSNRAFPWSCTLLRVRMAVAGKKTSEETKNQLCAPVWPLVWECCSGVQHATLAGQTMYQWSVALSKSRFWNITFFFLFLRKPYILVSHERLESLLLFLVLFFKAIGFLMVLQKQTRLFMCFWEHSFLSLFLFTMGMSQKYWRSNNIDTNCSSKQGFNSCKFHYYNFRNLNWKITIPLLSGAPHSAPSTRWQHVPSPSC